MTKARDTSNLVSSVTGIAVTLSGDPVVLGVGNTEHVRVTGIGSVGIGTDNPSEKLDVRGHLKIDNGPVLENHESGDALRVTTPSGYCSICLLYTSDAADE